MAEFQEVMRQFGRMCGSFKGCGECPLAKSDIEGIYMCENGITAFDYEAAEPLILRWAAEHPEPVYETWLKFIKRFETGKPKSDKDFIYWMGTTSIPAEIAQKLGIEPNEGT